MKKLINDVLGLAGLHLTRTKRRRPREVIVKVGRYDLVMSGMSLLPDIFRDNPMYSSDLGRVALLCSQKYKDCVVLDVGANYGDSVAIIKSSADLPIICIEGDAQAFEFLQRNIGQFESVEAFQYFLGERSETVTATIEKSGWNATLLPGAGKAAARVDIHALDDLFGSLPMKQRRCKLMKVDTEGFDCRILRGAERFLKMHKPIVTFEYNRENMNAIGEVGVDTLWRLGDWGYDRILFYDGQARLLLATGVANREIIADLHNYADGRGRAIYNYDIYLFHAEDADLASRFERSERERRDRG